MLLRIGTCLFALCVTVSAFDTEEQTVRDREKAWNDSILKHDAAAAERFMSPDYFLARASAGQPMVTVPRSQWLETLKTYFLEDMHLGEMMVHVYGDVATVAYKYSQTAKANGPVAPPGDALITDIWVKRNGNWKVTARYSSRFVATP
jgi:ketosteroid isomerase-like protein